MPEPPVPNLQEGLTETLSRIATIREEPVNYRYQPPEGAVLTDPPKEGIYYQLAPPNPQTDRLQPFERRYLIPLALSISPCFNISPITDDIYRKLPEYSRLKNMFFVISRSGIQVLPDGFLQWDSLVLVVRRFCVVRVQTLLHPAQDRFLIRRVFLWSSRNQRYEVVEDPQSGKISAQVLPYILDQYNQIEGIIRF